MADDHRLHIVNLGRKVIHVDAVVVTDFAQHRKKVSMGHR